MVDIKVEQGTPKAPPKKATVTKPTPVQNEMPQTLAEQRTDAVDGMFQLAGMGCVLVGWYADAGAINMHQHDISVEVAELAESNTGVAKIVDTFLQVGPYAALVAAVLPLAMQLLANHKVIPVDKMAGANVVKPEVLEAQVKTAMARQAMEALQAQRDAEQELAAMQEEMASYKNGQEVE